MSAGPITFHIRFAWWFKPCLYGVFVVNALTGWVPRQERLERWVGRAMTVEPA